MQIRTRLNDASSENIPGEQQLAIAAFHSVIGVRMHEDVCMQSAAAHTAGCSLDCLCQARTQHTTHLVSVVGLKARWFWSGGNTNKRAQRHALAHALLLYACLPAQNSICILHWVVSSMTNQQVFASTCRQLYYIPYTILLPLF